MFNQILTTKAHDIQGWRLDRAHIIWQWFDNRGLRSLFPYSLRVGDRKEVEEGFVFTQGYSPHPEFKFSEPKRATSLGTKAPKKSHSAGLSFEHLLERFIAVFPGGFDDPEFDADERQFKEAAVAEYPLKGVPSLWWMSRRSLLTSAFALPSATNPAGCGHQWTRRTPRIYRTACQARYDRLLLVNALAAFLDLREIRNALIEALGAEFWVPVE